MTADNSFSLEQLKQALQRGQGVAAWALPGASTATIVAGPVHESLTLDEPGFIIRPFLPQDRPLIIHPEQMWELPHEQVPREGDELPWHYSQPNLRVLDKTAYQQWVQAAVEALRLSELEKVVMARVEQVDLPKHTNPWQLFLEMLENAPHAFVSLLSLPEKGTWAGMSPELLLSVQDGRLETRAVAGTQEEQDAFTPKEAEEQRWVRVHIRQCLETLGIPYQETEPGPVAAANLYHLVSSFGSPEAAKWHELLECLHPTPAVCGVPTEAALQFIVKNEGFSRQLYSGYLGPANMAGGTHLYVNLRCMQWLEDKALLYAGAGIVEGSLPESELEETEMKMLPLKKLLQ